MIVSATTAPLHQFWIQCMIPTSSGSQFRSRLHPRKYCEQLVSPSLLYALGQALVMLLPMSAAPVFFNSSSPWSSVVDTLALLCMACTTIVCVLIPAGIILTRIEVASFPTDEPTFVPIDRTFLNAASSSVGEASLWSSYITSLLKAVRSLSGEVIRKSAQQSAIWTTMLVAASCVHQG